MVAQDRVRRLLKLIEVLQAGRIQNAKKLAEHCAVSKRTIFRDINLLQHAGLQIAYDEQQQGYRFYGNRFLVPPDFTVEETLTLITLCEHLSDPHFGLPFSEPASTAAMKLQSSLSPQLRTYIGEVLDTVSVRIESRNPLHDSKDDFELLRNAITQKKRVQILYHSYTDRADLSLLLNPYCLFFQKRSWYVVGRSSLHRAIRTFNIGRILSAKLTKKKYKVPARFQLGTYLGNAWSLIRQKPYNTKVTIRFKSLVASNVADVQWHKTQEIEHRDDGSIDFHVTVDGLNEIAWWILGYGSSAEVIKPKALQTIIKGHAKKMLDQYP